MTIYISKHPLIAHKISLLRDKHLPSNQYRSILHEIGLLLSYEVTSNLTNSFTRSISSHFGQITGPELAVKVAILPILRSGLSLLDSFLLAIPTARVYHLGLFREQSTLQPVEYYNKLPKEITVDVGIVLDPLIATAGTAIAAINIIKDWGLSKIKVVSVLGSKEGVELLQRSHQDIDIYLGAMEDANLTSDGLMVPGIGDLGDRLFNLK